MTRIGRWSLDLAQRTITDYQQTPTLTPRSWEVLIYLIEHRGELVSKETLLDQCWHGRVIDEAQVRKSISEIRRVIGDDGGSPEHLRTVRKRGYVLLHDEAGNAPTPDENASIAVLPVANLGGNGADDTFTDGLTEELIHRLSLHVETPVVARTSTLKYKGVGIDVRVIGRALNAGYVLESSTRWAEDRIRVTVQLINAATGAHVWSEIYERPPGDDGFSTQEDVAEAVSLEVRRRIAAAEHQSDRALSAVHVSGKFAHPDEFKKIIDTIAGQSRE